MNLFAAEDVFQLEYAADPRLSSDGRKLVYVRRSADIMVDRFRGALWLIDVDAGTHEPLLADQKSYSSPRWSPTADRVAYLTGEDDGRWGPHPDYGLPGPGGGARPVARR